MDPVAMVTAGVPLVAVTELEAELDLKCLSAAKGSQKAVLCLHKSKIYDAEIMRPKHCCYFSKPHF